MRKFYAIGLYPHKGASGELCIRSTSLARAKAEALRDYEADTLLVVDDSTDKYYPVRIGDVDV